MKTCLLASKSTSRKKANQSPVPSFRLAHLKTSTHDGRLWPITDCFRPAQVSNLRECKEQQKEMFKSNVEPEIIHVKHIKAHDGGRRSEERRERAAQGRLAIKLLLFFFLLFFFTAKLQNLQITRQHLKHLPMKYFHLAITPGITQPSSGK